jgi:hypothetical protein
VRQCDPTPEPDRSYLSEENKETFTIVAGVLAALFFVLQFVGPMAAIFVLMPGIATRMTFARYEVGGSALFRGEIYVVESTEGLRATQAVLAEPSGEARY